MPSIAKKFILISMGESVDWEDKKYKEAFDSEIRVLTRRRNSDAHCTIADLQGTLDSLYVLDGNGGLGRSVVEQISLSATIAAYEAFIHEWRKELAE